MTAQLGTNCGCTSQSTAIPKALAPHCRTMADDNPQHTGLQADMMSDMQNVLCELESYWEVFVALQSAVWSVQLTAGLPQ